MLSQHDKFIIRAQSISDGYDDVLADHPSFTVGALIVGFLRDKVKPLGLLGLAQQCRRRIH